MPTSLTMVSALFPRYYARHSDAGQVGLSGTVHMRVELRRGFKVFLT